MKGSYLAQIYGVRLGVLPLSTPSPSASLQVDMLRTVEQRHDRMVPYIIRRLLWMVPTLLAMALMTFTIMHLTPGSPLDPVADNANPLSPEAQRNMAKQYGLDKPLWQQFVILLYGVF